MRGESRRGAGNYQILAAEELFRSSRARRRENRCSNFEANTQLVSPKFLAPAEARFTSASP